MSVLFTAILFALCINTAHADSCMWKTDDAGYGYVLYTNEWYDSKNNKAFGWFLCSVPWYHRWAAGMSSVRIYNTNVVVPWETAQPQVYHEPARPTSAPAPAPAAVEYHDSGYSPPVYTPPREAQIMNAEAASASRHRHEASLRQQVRDAQDERDEVLVTRAQREAKISQLETQIDALQIVLDAGVGEREALEAELAERKGLLTELRDAYAKMLDEEE